MEQTKPSQSLPDNAYRELKPGEEYVPMMAAPFFHALKQEAGPMIGAIPVLDAGHEFIRGTGLARPFQICLEHFLRVFQLVAGMELAKNGIH